MTMLERPRKASDAGAETHPAPGAATRCDLWLTLRTRHAGSGARVGLSHDQPSIYLHLRSSNLLLALPDEDPKMLDGEAAVEIRLQLTDALGLGLEPSDFEDGAGLCGGPEGAGIGEWRCRGAIVVGVRDDGRELRLLGPNSFRRWRDGRS